MSPNQDDQRTAGAPIPAWLPNAISVVRILLVPVFIWLASEVQLAAREELPTGGPRAGAFATLLAIGLSDLLDGFLARRYRLASVLGATLDALADKIAQVGLLVFFTLDRGPGFATVPVWFVVFILARDLYMLTGWLIVRRKRAVVNVVHKAHGKLASVLIFLVLLWITTGATGELLLPTLWLIVAVVVGSCASYFRDGWVQLRGASREAG